MNKNRYTIRIILSFCVFCEYIELIAKFEIKEISRFAKRSDVD